MPFVQGNCPNCGGTLAVDNEKDAWVCPYCNTPFIVEKAINNYNVTNNISASTVNIFSDSQKDFEVTAGNLKKYNGEATEVVIPENVTTISYSAFHETNITSLKLPEGIKEVYLSSCKFLKELVLPESVINIGLKNCSSLEKIELHEGLKFVYFEGCSSIKDLRIPSTVTKLQKGTFWNCSSLSNLLLPNSLSIIEDAFVGCNNLDNLTIPPNVESVCLSSMKKLKNVVIPPNTKTVHLNNTPNLTTVVVGNPQIRIVGLTGKETLVYKDVGYSSSVLFKPPLITKNPFSVNKRALEIILAKYGKCSYCGGSFSVWFGNCKECGAKKSYNIVNNNLIFLK
ncbi:Leucine rich repeat-containing protein [Ruminococcus sp. YRD2003]|uniref:leucine-rich repeat domain-containing protein n=1 Tax=Ruminococcus sp. YRD2003 TaxID=1452313 RepID=UPI0008BFFCB7|nr:Leucine rich repeat-containing protein [Ruminococcus flavefaciens]